MRTAPARVAWACVFLVLATSGVHGQDRRAVTGLAASARDSTPLVGVTARVVEYGIVANSDSSGAFVLPNVPRVAVRVAFERFGLEPDTLVLPPDRDTLMVYLRPTAFELAPIAAEAQNPARQRFDQSAQTSTVTLEAAEITGAPAFLEADVIRTVQLLPGIVAKNDFTTGFNVRGGESDQNLIQLDGATVFNPTHLGGLFSTFDAFAVREVNFVTGGFPAEYGGRLSSVLDIGLHSGNTEGVGVRGQLSLLSAKVLVDGPLGSGGASYMVGVRRTYADALVGAFSSEVLPYYFADVIGRLAVPLGDARLSATGYWGGDVLDLPFVDEEPGRSGVDLEFDWGNRLLALNFEKPLGDKRLHLHASASGFDTQFALVPDLIDITNDVRMLSARWDLALSPFAAHDVRIGAGVEDYSMTYDFNSVALGADVFQAAYRPRIWSAFIDDQWHPFGWLLIRPGVRVESVEGAGFTGVAPRMSVKAFVSSDLALTGSAGRYYQAIHSIRDQEIPVAIFDFWIGADDFIPVARSDHLVLGFEKWFASDYSLSLEGYRKTFDRLVTANREQDLKIEGDEFIPADGDAWGADLLLRKYRGNLRGWIAYSYTKATRRVEGEEFPPAHDRRHTVNVVFQTDGPLGSDMSVRWGFGSPLPYTGFIGEWRHREYEPATHSFLEFREEPVAAERRNTERFPSYNRLDLSFRWRTEKWGGVLYPYVQLVNAYNRKNVFVYLFDYDDSPAIRTGFSQLPLLPSFGVEFQF
jgi:hypothetical protein